MIISLDRNALRDLIDKDEEFELSLKSAVLSEIGRRFFAKDAARIIREADSEIFDKLMAAMKRDEDITELVRAALSKAFTQYSGGWNRKVDLTPDLQHLIQTEVDKAKTSVEARVSREFSEVIEKKLIERLDAFELDKRLDRRISRLTEEEIDRRAQAKFEERWAQVKEAMG